jgi:hypothetical protein
MITITSYIISSYISEFNWNYEHNLIWKHNHTIFGVGVYICCDELIALKILTDGVG